MTTEEKHVAITAHGETLAEATISPNGDGAEVRVAVNVAPGHLPVGARQRLTDAIHELVVEDGAERVTAAVPLGDAELVERLRDHLSDVELRAAGASTIVEGEVAPE